MVFHFRMLSDENDNFVRDYQVLYDMSLLDFHRFICQDLGFDDENMCSFYLSDSQWDKLQEYTLMDMGLSPEETPEGMPIAMDSVLLGQVVQNKNERLIYLFDVLGDRALYLELMQSMEASESATYPLVSLSESAAPGQFEPNEDDDNGSIFDDVMSEFDDFSGDDQYDDEY